MKTISITKECNKALNVENWMLNKSLEGDSYQLVGWIICTNF